MANEFDVPTDFPRPTHLGAVPGAQNKILATQYEGRFYTPGCTPPELYASWQYCMSLVEQFVLACVETKSGKRRDMLEVDILNQYLTRLIVTGWCSEEECRWIFRETAKLLGWPAPEAALLIAEPPTPSLKGNAHE